MILKHNLIILRLSLCIQVDRSCMYLGGICQLSIWLLGGALLRMPSSEQTSLKGT